MSGINSDPNNFEFERCADCVGVDCTMAVRLAGGWPAFNLDMEVDAVLDQTHTMDIAAERIAQRRANIPQIIQSTASRMLREFGCGWSEPRLQQILTESVEFYDQHGTPPVPKL